MYPRALGEIPSIKMAVASSPSDSDVISYLSRRPSECIDEEGCLPLVQENGGHILLCTRRTELTLTLTLTMSQSDQS